MTINIKFFGQLRDLVKLSETEIEVREETTAGDLVGILGERFPNIREHMQTVSIAVDNEYAAKKSELYEGCEVALIPPISGGSGK
ncbi:MAG: molybdopterin converting factor subunit 1 [bacterium]